MKIQKKDNKNCQTKILAMKKKRTKLGFQPTRSTYANCDITIGDNNDNCAL